MKNKIQIHKNSLKNYLVKPGTYKLGEEEMVRWVDIPEYIVLEPVRTVKSLNDDVSDRTISDYAHGYQQGIIAEQKRYQTHMENKKSKSIKFPFKEETAIGFREIDGYVTPLKSFYSWMQKVTEKIVVANTVVQVRVLHRAQWTETRRG